MQNVIALVLVAFFVVGCSSTPPDPVLCEGEDCNNGNLVCEDELIGEPCGPCMDGVFECTIDEGVYCAGERQQLDACGGCGDSAVLEGDVCGECGTWECDGDLLTCAEPSACACEPDAGTCMAGCDQSFWECVDGAQVCNVAGCTLAGLAEACVDGAACESTHCSNGFCAPVGFAFVPSGMFTMGAPLDEPGRHVDRENGQHDVTITRPMFVKETTVTQGEWEAMFGANPSYFANCGEACPVERVNMFEMFLYANMLSEQDGLEQCYNLVGCEAQMDNLNTGCPISTRAGLRCSTNVFYCDELAIEPSLDCDGYRLATESEWEYFARAGTTTAFITPDGTYENWAPTFVDPAMDAIAWYTANSAVTYETNYTCLEPETRLDCNEFPADISLGTSPVGQKLPNAWGLYDMTGNIWERVWDIKETFPEPGTSVTDPTGPVPGEIGLARSMRGGSFHANGKYLRVAYRSGPNAYARNFSIGFRVVRSVVR